MCIAELDGRRVAVWGFGREGKAALTAVRGRLPHLPLTLFAGPDEMAAARAFDPSLQVLGHEPGAQELGAFDVVIKSPGISAYHPALLSAQASGTRISSGTALWFAENPDARVVGVTGTKGKSTTSALIAHLARAAGVRTALAGNIGLPLLELLDQQAPLWVVELSSFQTGEAGALALGVITSLYEEHLDWHGSRERYVDDKLKLAAVARTLLVNATQPALLERTAGHPDRRLVGDASGWHVRDGQIHRGGAAVCALAALSLPGLHNALNACAALAAIEACGLDAIAAASNLASFRPLPHRLQPLGRRQDLEWINDSISTTPQATLAALQSVGDRAVTVIVGGHDRGLDWSPFVDGVRSWPLLRVIVQGANGPRIARALADAAASPWWRLVAGLEEAVTLAREQTPAGGLVLLSPGAPSFDQFRDYAERGARFAALAGFDSRCVGIEGLGIA